MPTINKTCYSLTDVKAWWVDNGSRLIRGSRSAVAARSHSRTEPWELLEVRYLTPLDSRPSPRTLSRLDPHELGQPRAWLVPATGRVELYLPDPKLFGRLHLLDLLPDSHFLSAQIDLSNGFLPRISAARPDGEPAIRLLKGRYTVPR